MEMKREQIKILVLGAGAVGKTCLTLQYVRNEFVCGYTPTIEEVYETPARVEDSLYILQILDTAGTDECGIIREQFYHQCDGYLLLFSVTDRFSLQEIKEIQKDIKRQVNRSIPFLVVGNKIDLSESRKISSDEGETIASMLGGEYIETSAKFHINVDRVFHTLVSKIQHNNKVTDKKTSKKERKAKKGKCSIL
ncbi:hypothetical protein LOD99_12990 [Oopsacas minuta]|uniref:Uncharacterized protein n=1 Tax=Oopsacas minuta TaxID=111878 RepID=A0AAV7J811_9METZ|nr:hypothetical protein LOD99_12990 [Oopsacas minuta]